MANTLGDLKARIIAETDRDDLGAGQPLEAQLLNAIQRAIEHHSDEAFWFNRDSGTTSTTTGRNYVIKPYAVRVVDKVVYNGCALRKAPVQEVDGAIPTGAPPRWAMDGDLIRISPIADGVYPLSVFGTAQIDPPENDTDESVWTTEAQDLIAARTRFLLFRDVFRDMDGTQLAAQAEGEALTRLRRETRRRGSMPLRSTGDEPWTGCRFDITRG